MRLNHISGNLASAYIISKDIRYLQELIPHLKAWFVDESTKMNPSLMYAQAIKGKTKGRGIGIIDTIHLVEVALAIEILEDAMVSDTAFIQNVKNWFQTYLDWLVNHPFGIKERDNGNNHSVCWALQVAAFARLTEDTQRLDYCRNFYKNVLLPEQMDCTGSFPKEIARTKPYSYSLFTLDAMSNLCLVASTRDNNLFEYETHDSVSIQLGLTNMYPYILDKNEWAFADDVMYFEFWPVRQSSLLFAGIALENEDYLKLWKELDGNFINEEVERNMPVKYPLLWLENSFINPK